MGETDLVRVASLYGTVLVLSPIYLQALKHLSL